MIGASGLPRPTGESLFLRRQQGLFARLGRDQDRHKAGLCTELARLGVARQQFCFMGLKNGETVGANDHHRPDEQRVA
jgi:hypothetical protein